MIQKQSVVKAKKIRNWTKSLVTVTTYWARDQRRNDDDAAQTSDNSLITHQHKTTKLENTGSDRDRKSWL